LLAAVQRQSHPIVMNNSNITESNRQLDRQAKATFLISRPVTSASEETAQTC